MCARLTCHCVQVATSNVLVDRMKRSEREVIKDWLENIFKTWEKTNDLEIREFKLTQLEHDSPVPGAGPGSGRANGGGVPSNGNGANGHQHSSQPTTQADRLVSRDDSRGHQCLHEYVLTGPTRTFNLWLRPLSH